MSRVIRDQVICVRFTLLVAIEPALRDTNWRLAHHFSARTGSASLGVVRERAIWRIVPVQRGLLRIDFVAADSLASFRL